MAFDLNTLDAPFAGLAGFDWGADADFFKSIDAAVVAAHGDASLRGDLEKRFGTLLAGSTSRATKEYVCRKLAMIGTGVSVPALAALLTDADNSHMARFALERIDLPEAAAALRKALGMVEGSLKIGMISSLAARGDLQSVAAISNLLGGDVAAAVIDARLACAEALLAKGDRKSAKAIYSSISAAIGDTPKTHRERAVRVAAKRGLLAAAE